MSDTEPAAQTLSDKLPETEFRANAITLIDSIILSLASAAPTSVIAASLGAMILISGYGGGLAVIVAGIPLLGIAVGYKRLNEWDPRCAASYNWVSLIFGPYLGFFMGWLMLMGYVLTVGANPFGLTPALFAILHFHPTGALATFVTAAFAIIMVSVAAWLGIVLAARVQRVLIITEYAIMLVFVILALKAVFIDKIAGSVHPSLSWFTISGAGGIHGLFLGVVLAVFFYSDWEGGIYENEETTDRRENPGRAGVIGMALMIFIFTIFVVAFQGVVPRQAILNAPGGALVVVADRLAPSPWNYLALFAIVEAVLSTMLANAVETGRLLYGMSTRRDGMLPVIFSRVTQRYKTPGIATFTVAGLGILILALYLANVSIGRAISDTFSAIGIMFAVFYAVTGLACTWFSRARFRESWRDLVYAGIIPGVSSVFLLGVVAYSVPHSPFGENIALLVTVVTGVIVLVWARSTGRTGYFGRGAKAVSEVEGN